MLATYVIETVGTQEYELGRGGFLARFAEAYGADAAAEVEPHLRLRRARRRRHAGRAARRPRWRLTWSAPSPVRTWSGSAPTWSRAPCSRRTGAACSRWALGPDGAPARSAGGRPDPRGVLPLEELRVSRSLRQACRTFEMRVDTAFDEVVAGVRRPGPGRALDHPGDRACVRRAAPPRLGALRGVLARRRAGRWPLRGGHRRPVRGRVDVPPRHRRLEGRAGRPRRPRLRRRRPAAAARRAVAHRRTWRASGSSRCRAPDYLPPPRGGARAAPARAVEATSRYRRPPRPERLRRADHHHEPLVRRPVGVDLVRDGPQHLAAHPAPRRHVVPAAGSVASTVDDGAGGGIAAWRRRAGSPAAGSAGRGRRPRLPVTGPPPRARRGRPPPRPAAPCGTAPRRGTPGPTASSGRVTRTLPWVSTPIAASTWLGSSVLAVQAEPLATAKPRRSSSSTSASPSTYRHEKVTTCGSRSAGSPTTSVSGTAAAAARIRSTSAAARASLGRARWPRRPARPRRPPAPAATTGSPRAPAARARLAGPGRRHRRSCGRRARRPRRGRPTSGRRRPGRRTPAGRRVAAERGPGVHQQRHPGGRGRAATPRPPAAACRPRRWPPARPAATVARRGQARSSASTSTRPSRSTGTSSKQSASPVVPRVAAGVQERRVLDGGGDQPRAPATSGVQQPAQPGSQRDRARRQ